MRSFWPALETSILRYKSVALKQSSYALALADRGARIIAHSHEIWRGCLIGGVLIQSTPDVRFDMATLNTGTRGSRTDRSHSF